MQHARVWLISMLRRSPNLYRKLRLIYRTLTLGPQSLEGQIRQRLRALPRVFFVQVGSNDGRSGDPISRSIHRERHWSGIFIEPIPDIFQRLKTHYGPDPRFIYENVLIGSNRETAKFYHVSDRAKQALGDALPGWYDQLGSFSRDHIVKHLDGLLEPYIVEVELPCVLLQDVLDRHAVQRIDLLHVDTEGYDYAVLAQFDFDRYRPAVVLYEHKHLSVELRHKAEELLAVRGYSVHPRSADTLAIFPP